jgi:hypothetical protein
MGGFLLAMATTGGVVYVLGVDVPIHDQWPYAEDLVRHLSTAPTVRELAQPVNEHRLLFPRALMLLLARMTDWNIRAELLAAFLVAVVAVVALLLAVRPLIRRQPLILLAVGALYFSLYAWQNWLWSWQIQIWLNVLGATMAVVALAGPTVRRVRFVVAAAGFVFAAYSFAAGLALGPVGLLLLGRRSGGRSEASLLGWAGLTAAIAVHYAAGYSRPEGHPAMATSFSPGALLFGLVCLGAPVSLSSVGGVWLAASLGTLGLLSTLLLVLASRAVRTSRVGRVAIGILLYGALACALTAFGRSGFGVQLAYQSRYGTYAALFWMGLVFLGGLTCPSPLGGRRWWVRGGICAVALLATVRSVESWPAVVAYARETRQARDFLLDRERQAVVEAPTPSGRRIVKRLAREVRVLQTTPDQLERALPLLRGRGLSLYRRSGRPPG